MPSLTGAVSSELIESAKGPQGTTYSLLAGVNTSGSQVIGVVRQALGNNKVVLAEIETGIDSNFSEHLLDLTIDSTGNTYIMYDVANNLGDVAVSKVGANGGVLWTTTIASQWRDIDWNLHPTIDAGSSIEFSTVSNSVYVLSRRRQGEPVPTTDQPFVNRLNPSNGNISWTRFFNVTAVTSPGRVVADQAGDATVAFCAGIIPDPEEEEPNLSAAIIAAKFDPAGNQLYGTFLQADTDLQIYSAATGSDDSLLLAAGMTFVDSKGEPPVPYFSLAQLAVKFDTFGGGIFAVVRRELDPTLRPGMIFPHAIVPDINGGAYIAGGFNTYADPILTGYVEHLDSAGFSDLGVTTSDTYGEYWSVGLDSYSNVYLGGYRTAVGGTGFKNQATVTKLDPALDIETNTVFLRKEYVKPDPSGYVPTSANLVPAGLNVFPVSKANPTFAVNDGTKVGGKWIASGALLQVKDNPEVIGFSLDSTTVLAGYPVKVKYTIDRPAPEGGYRVRLQSSNESLLASRSYVIPAGQKSGEYKFTAPKTTTSRSLNLFAGPNYMLSSALTINPISLTLTTDKKALVKNDTFTLTVHLANPAPVGGLTIPLKSNRPLLITVPSSIKIPAEHTDVQIPLSVNGEVTQNTIVTISGGFGFTASTTVTVVPVGVQSVTLDKSIVFGGNPVVATINLSGPAPAGSKVKLSSTIDQIKVPKTVTIPTGATSLTVPVTTLSVNNQVSGYVSAEFNSTARAALTLTAISVESITAASQILGGKALLGTVTLNRVAPASGTVVTIQSDKAAIPSTTVTVAPGTKTASFSIATMPVAVDTVTTLIGTTNDVFASTQTTVRAPKINTISFDPGTINTGQKTVMTIRLNGPAPQGGIVVALASSNNGALSVPPTITIPGGAKAFNVNLTGGSVTGSTVVVLTATLNDVATNANVTVKP